MTKIFMLFCEDASQLGGPMGTEKTELLFSDPYETL